MYATLTTDYLLHMSNSHCKTVLNFPAIYVLLVVVLTGTAVVSPHFHKLVGKEREREKPNLKEEKNDDPSFPSLAVGKKEGLISS